MELKDLLQSQVRENARLVKELREHENTKPAVDAEFARIDKQCVTLARELTPAQIAGSPSAITIAGELKLKRWERDGIRAAYGRKRDELIRQIEATTREDIHDFHWFCLDQVKDLSRRYKYQHLETIKNPFNDKRTVKISHNSAALQAAQKRIFEAMKEVDSMNLALLPDIHAKIEKFDSEFRNFRFSTMVIEEVGEATAQAMAPGKPDNIIPDKLQNLSARLDRLERT